MSAMLDDEVAMTFPLPLSPFEKFILWDERPHQPMTIFVELHFATPLDPDKLLAAVTRAVHLHPLLACRIVQRDAGLCWDYDPHFQPKLLSPLTQPPLPQGRPIPIDLRRECGGRYWYGARGNSWRLLFQMHHACCDGVGMRQVLIDVLLGYAQAAPAAEVAKVATNQRLAKLAPVEPLQLEALDEERPPGASSKSPPRWGSRRSDETVALLVDRFDFSKAYAKPPKRSLSVWQRLKNAHYFHFHLPVVLRGTANDGGFPQNVNVQEPLRHAQLSREQSEQILTRTRELQIGINDLALALMFQACCRWNRQLGDRRSRSHIRLLMPYDLRSRHDLKIPATNRLSFSFLGRDANQCEDFDRLLASVQQETQSIKETRLPLDFLDALRLASRFPRSMRWVINRSRRMATVVLTYTGDLSRGMHRYFPECDGARMVGESLLTHIYAAPPIRENTNVAVGLCVNWGQLCFSAAWNPDALTAAECEQFLAQYAAGWSDWLERSCEPQSTSRSLAGR